MQRKTLRAIVRKLFTLFSRVEVTGLENVPLQGGYILATNHLGRLDAPLVFATVDREDCTALVADKYKKDPFFSWLVVTVKGIWINREDADIHALREARSFLQSGGILGIAPEGTRSRTGALDVAKTGVAYLADKAGVAVIPVAITGSETAVHSLLRLRRPRLTIQFGLPMKMPPVPRGERDAGLQHNTDEIMCRIAAMLPPAYRGAYASHPRLLGLLSEVKMVAEISLQPV
jgi:1-acyl-sn-glycerol-3-phosphate acyltransferase